MMASGDATIRHLYARTATFVDTRDRPFSKNAGWEVFSGTFVRIGHRLFVATVSHSIDNFENPSRFVLTAKNGQPHPNGSKIVLDTIATDHDRPDVGLIELNTELFGSFDGHQSVGLDRISLLPPECHLSSLMGTPSETVQIHPIENGKWGIGGTLSGFTTSAIDHASISRNRWLKRLICWSDIRMTHLTFVMTLECSPSFPTRTGLAAVGYGFMMIARMNSGCRTIAR